MTPSYVARTRSQVESSPRQAGTLPSQIRSANGHPRSHAPILGGRSANPSGICIEGAGSAVGCDPRKVKKQPFKLQIDEHQWQKFKSAIPEDCPNFGQGGLIEWYYILEACLELILAAEGAEPSNIHAVDFAPSPITLDKSTSRRASQAAVTAGIPAGDFVALLVNHGLEAIRTGKIKLSIVGG